MDNNNHTRLDVDLNTDIIELVSKIWKNKHLIIRWCIAGAVIGLIIGFSIPKTYTSSVTFAPETEQRANSSVSSIASMMGVTLNNSVDAISVEMFPDVVHSVPFITELLTLPVEFKWKDGTIETTLLDYMLEYQKSPWWSYVVSAPFKAISWMISIVRPEETEEIITSDIILDPYNLPKDARRVVKFFSENIRILVDKKTDKISMSLQLQDPNVVAAVMSAVVDNLKAYISDYRTSKARQDVENLSKICEERKDDYYKAQQAYANFADANKNVILLSAQAEKERLQQEMNLAYQVYSQVASQLEGARIQEQQAKPVFVIIDPVTLPIKKSAPSKAMLLILFTFLAGCCAAAWVLFGDDYWRKLKENL